MNEDLLPCPLEKSPGGVGVAAQNLVNNIIMPEQVNGYYLVHYEQNSNPIYGQHDFAATTSISWS